MNRIKIRFNIESLPATVKEYARNAEFYDSSCSETARTLYMEGSEKAYLKISKSGSLEREYRMSGFLNRYALAPKVLCYEKDAENDYLLTEAVAGEDGISGRHLEHPEKLAAVFGESLRRLHSLSKEGCPFNNRTAEILKEVRENIERNSGDIDAISEDTNALEKLESLKCPAADEVVLHGDYCLPNIIMDHFSFQSFIDVGFGGIGDRHYDISKGIWTLRHNLKTERFKEPFLDAYGRKDIDRDRLEWFCLLESLDW